jgi:tryptophan halogenase
MLQQKKQIVIVGGGSSGWMTASYLKKSLGEKAEVTVIESPNIPTVGVGEATFSTLHLFFDFLELKEEDWMPHCSAGYKMGIKFVNWNADGKHFYHPFQRYETVDGFHMGEWWLKLRDTEAFKRARGGDQRFDYSCFVVPELCDLQKSPRYLDGTVFDPGSQQLLGAESGFRKGMLDNLKVQYPYAFHFDASRLALYLTGYAKKLGAKHVVDDVVDVKLAADGSIQHVQTRGHGSLEADIFVDCTGFRGLLINKALEEPFISFASQLLCDRAIAIQMPRDNEKMGMNPYTQATAMKAGWSWNIPLYDRDGTGYVYSSAFVTPEEAEREYRAHLGPASEGRKANHIQMRIGRNRNSWVKNCVAIGLSSGFVEPLESTGIFFIQHAVEQLVSHLSGEKIDPLMVKSYNKVVADVIDGVRDFLTLHYYAATRADNEFWRATKQLKFSDELRERFDLWERRLPNARNINPSFHGFEDYSYSVMLMGLGLLPKQGLPVLEYKCDKKALEVFKALKQRTDHLVATLPTQYEYLTEQMKRANISQSMVA